MRTAIFLVGIVIADAIDRYSKKEMSDREKRFLAAVLVAFIIMDIVDFFK